MKLTPKQKAFVEYYIETGNATESAIREKDKRYKFLKFYLNLDFRAIN